MSTFGTSFQIAHFSVIRFGHVGINLIAVRAMSLMGSKTPVAAASFGAGAHDASELEALRRYLPTGLRDRLCRGNNGDWSGDGIALIADISGYSRTASWLQERDRVGGAEQLSSCVNDYISEMVAIIESFGGDILHFAGDALICIWRLPEPDASVAGGLRPRARRDARCGGSASRRLVLPPRRSRLRESRGVARR